MYTDRRWKIHTTSHGILIIATLMVPLNFLAIAAFTQASPPTDLLSLSGEAISLVVFAMLMYFAGRIFVPADATLLAIAVIVPCLMQLLIRRFAGTDDAVRLCVRIGRGAHPHLPNHVECCLTASLGAGSWRVG